MTMSLGDQSHIHDAATELRLQAKRRRWALMHPDIDSKAAWDAADELLMRLSAQKISMAMEEILDGPNKARYEHLSWPAILLHILVRADDV